MAVILPNLNFELELQGGAERWPRRLLDAVPQLVVLGGPGDVFLSPEPVEVPPALAPGLPRVVALDRASAAELRGQALIPWGASEGARAVAERLGLTLDAPPIEVVRRVNDKAFSHALEARLGVGLPRSTLVASSVDLGLALAAFSPGESAVLKEPLGFGGQGRLLVRGPRLTPAQEAWVAPRLASGPLLVEPWLARVGSYSTQIDVTQGGSVRLVGMLRGMDTAGGRYQGSAVGGIPGAVAGMLATVAVEVGRALAAEGYYGPAGIDAFSWDDGNRRRLRPLVEINARMTFGLVALRWIQRLGGGRGAWELLPPDAERAGPAPSRVRTCAGAIGGRPSHRVGVWHHGNPPPPAARRR